HPAPVDWLARPNLEAHQQPRDTCHNRSRTARSFVPDGPATRLCAENVIPWGQHAPTHVRATEIAEPEWHTLVGHRTNHEDPRHPGRNAPAIAFIVARWSDDEDVALDAATERALDQRVCFSGQRRLTSSDMNDARPRVPRIVHGAHQVER